MKETKTCCFFGHRKITETVQLRARLYKIIEGLIIYNNTEIFLFGSKSDFDKLCLSVVTELKDKYPHIKRIYVRAEYPYIDEDYKAYLLQNYEDTYFPKCAIHAGKAVYIERNCEMIDKSNFCVIYYEESYTPQKRKNNHRNFTNSQPTSGTKTAYEYARKKNKIIIQTADF